MDKPVDGLWTREILLIHCCSREGRNEQQKHLFRSFLTKSVITSPEEVEILLLLLFDMSGTAGVVNR